MMDGYCSRRVGILSLKWPKWCELKVIAGKKDGQFVNKIERTT
jgi:hypothetical protein